MSNPYESGSQKIIPAVLLYAFYQDSVLMMHRNLKANDIHEGKWNGLGGKLEKGETPLEAASREFLEESGANVPTMQWQWSGQLFFPNFKAHKNEDWWVNVYVSTLTHEQAASVPLAPSPAPSGEGSLKFIEQSKLLDLNLWDGDLHFLPLVLKRVPFQGTFFYQNGKCTRFDLNPIRPI